MIFGYGRVRKLILKAIGGFLLFSLLILLPASAFAIDNTVGEELFIKHCSGCHINGGNIIRRRKTLKLKALQRAGLDNPESIARVAREGIGSMNGYEEVLGKDGDQLIANWIWTQVQNAWTQG